jgi:large subunit ribosomal protein L15
MSIDPSQLAPPEGATHSKKRVGRGNGSGHGTYAGRGLKGQKSRSGKGVRLAFEGGQMSIARKMHVLRGFSNARFKTVYQPINLSALERFSDGDAITPETLRAVGLLRHLRQPVKVLGEGALTKRLDVSADAFSATARERIEAAGGTATVLEKTPTTVVEG